MPCAGTLIFARALEAAGVDFELHLYRRGKHGLSTASLLTNPAEDLLDMRSDVPGWIGMCIRFFEEIKI